MKVHTNLYVGATDALVTPRSKAVLAIATGKRRTIQLPVAAAEGRLTAVYVKQASGTNVGFDVEVLSSATPYPVGASANYNAAAGSSVGPLRVIAKQTATSGNAVEWFEPTGQPYQNTDQSSQAESQRYLYLTIIPNNSSDASTWEVRVVTEHSGAYV